MSILLQEGVPRACHSERTLYSMSPSIHSNALESNNSFSTLPDDVLIEILRRLDVLDLFSCRLVCRRLNATFEASIELQYLASLGLDGMVDGQTTHSYRDRMDMLLCRRRAWSRVEWRKIWEFEMPGDCLAYELVAGVFAKLSDPKKLAVCWLPSADNISDEGRVLNYDLDFFNRDFAMDPTQDLIIFMIDDIEPDHYILQRTVNLRVCSLETMQPHRAAKTTMLSFTIPRSSGGMTNFVERAFIQIADDVVVIVVSTEADPFRVLLWNWKTGTQWMDITNTEYCDFGFISSRAFVILSKGGCGSISIFNLDLPTGALTPVLTHVATLGMPPILPNIPLVLFGSHTAPFLNHLPHDKAFGASWESQIYVLTVAYGSHRHEPRLQGRFYLSNSFFLKYVRASSGPKPVDVSWNEWGPTNTRFIPYMSAAPWLRYCHGQRVILPATTFETLDGVVTSVIRLQDFNLHATEVPTKKFRHSDHTSVDRVVGPRPCSVEGIFRKEISTALPFRTFSHVLEGDYSAFLIDDERIIAIKSPGQDNDDFEDICVFMF